jgi:hypothetical protein
MDSLAQLYLPVPVYVVDARLFAGAEANGSSH